MENIAVVIGSTDQEGLLIPEDFKVFTSPQRAVDAFLDLAKKYRMMEHLPIVGPSQWQAPKPAPFLGAIFYREEKITTSSL